jgi:hypothetical protein
MPRDTPPRPAFPQPTSLAEQEAETDDAWPVIGVGPATGAQVRGALLWGVFGAAVGALLGVLFALIPFAGLTLLARMILVGGIGALAGATAGFVYGGGREAELEEDAGNQIGPPPAHGPIRDPEPAREAVEELRARQRRPRSA